MKLTFHLILFLSLALASCKKDDNDNKKSLTNLLVLQQLTTPASACNSDTLNPGVLEATSTPIELKFAYSGLRTKQAAHILVDAVKGRYFMAENTLGKIRPRSLYIYKTSDCAKATNQNLSEAEWVAVSENLPEPYKSTVTLLPNANYIGHIEENGKFLLEVINDATPSLGIKLSKAPFGP